MDDNRRDRAHVLVVDDEPVIIEIVERTLPGPFQVSGVTSGQAALALLRGGARFDAILCDLMMRGLGGMEVFNEVARIAPDQARRFAIVTGGAYLPHAEEFLRDCACRVLDKPFTRSELLACVRALMSA